MVWRNNCAAIDSDTWKGIVESSEPISLERKVGDKFYLFAHIRDAESDLVFVFGADITEQREAEKALREADSFVRLLLDSTGEGIYGVDMQGNCTFANPACARVLGFDSVDELLGQHMHNLVHHTRPNGDPYPVEECRIYRAFREQQGTHVADEVMFNPYWVRMEVTEIEDEGIARIVVRTRDQAVSVGSFLNPDDRRSFAHALRAALAEAKAPGV